MEHGMHGRARRSVGILAMTALIAGTAACGGSDSKASGSTGPEPASAGVIPAGFHRISGLSYEFGLPNSPVYVQDSQIVGVGGSLESRWRYGVTASGPFCLVLAIEQKNYTGDFPTSSEQLFANAGQPNQHTVRNEVLTPTPSGAAAALNQESTFTSTLSNGKSMPSHLYQRVYLTPGHSLIQFLVGGPEAQSSSCHYTDILATFSLTGQEFIGATPPPPTPSPSAIEPSAKGSAEPTPSPSTSKAGAKGKPASHPTTSKKSTK
jgi:hypothetical protein